MEFYRGKKFLKKVVYRAANSYTKGLVKKKRVELR